jgi:hypothetical protein
MSFSKLKGGARVALVALAMLVASATGALAAPVQLVCERTGNVGSHEKTPFAITLDVDAKTIRIITPGIDTPTTSAQITDSTISFDAERTDAVGRGTSRPSSLDRLTGVLHQQMCDRTTCCCSYNSQCHKAEKQF